MRHPGIVGIVSLLLAIVHPGQAQGTGKQLLLGCSPEFEVYCGGWVVSRGPASWDQNDVHLRLGERFVIGRRGQQHWLFPRDPLHEEERWNARQIRLDQMAGESTDCLVAEVRIKSGHESQSSAEAGKPHVLVITPVVRRPQELIGAELALEIEIGDALDPNDPCLVLSDEQAGGHRHAGTLHAED